MTNFDITILKTRSKKQKFLSNENKREEQKDIFRELLYSLNYDTFYIEDFLQEYYQNLATTEENFKDFLEFIKED